MGDAPNQIALPTDSCFIAAYSVPSVVKTKLVVTLTTSQLNTAKPNLTSTIQV